MYIPEYKILSENYVMYIQYIMSLLKAKKATKPISKYNI
jgi:hypothetical protein